MIATPIIQWYSNTFPRFYLTIYNYRLKDIDKNNHIESIAISICSSKSQIKFFSKSLKNRIIFNKQAPGMTWLTSPYILNNKSNTKKYVLVDDVSVPFCFNIANMIAVGYGVQQVIKEKG